VGVVSQSLIDLRAGEFGLVAGEVELCELHLGAGVGMAIRYLLPERERSIGFPQGG
jgi:hypothetical protein